MTLLQKHYKSLPILPYIIHKRNFGSEINGLVSSITQFLSFISLLEGGLGAVVLAELYLPIETYCMALLMSPVLFLQNTMPSKSDKTS